MLAPGMFQWRPGDQSFYGRDSTGWRKFLYSTILDDYYTMPQSDSFFARTDYSLSAWIPSYSGYHASEGSIINLGGDTLLNIFRLDSAMQHAGGKGQLVKRLSYDGGVTWTGLTVIYDSAEDDRNVVAQKLDNGRIVAIFRRYTVGAPTNLVVGRIYSDDGGATWSAFSAITVTQVTNALPFGNIIKGSDGAWHMIIHEGGLVTMHESTDNGLTWPFQANVYSGATLFGETYVAHIGSGKMIALSRDDSGTDSTYGQRVSSNNGDTWTYKGRVNMNSGVLWNNRTAPLLMWDSVRNVVIGMAYTRNQLSQSPFSPQQDSIFIYINHPDTVFASASKWTLTYRYRRPEAAGSFTYGYPTMTRLANGNYAGVYSENGTYDVGFGNGTSEKTSLYQFDINFAGKPRFPGLRAAFNPVTQSLDHLSTDYPQPDSITGSYTGGIWINALRNQVKLPFFVGTVPNNARFTVAMDGTATAFGKYEVSGSSPSVVWTETDVSGGLEALVNTNQFFLNRKSDGVNMFSLRFTDYYAAFTGTIQSNGGQFISRGSAPRYRFVNTGISNKDWQINSESGDFVIQRMNTDSSGIDPRAAFKENGQWVVTVTPPLGSVATDSIIVRAGDGTLKYLLPDATFIRNQSTGDQTGNFRITGTGRANGAFQITKDGSATISATVIINNAAATRGANFQLNADATPGLATWVHNGTTWQSMMTIQADGDVGVNQTNPTSKLTVAGALALPITSTGTNLTLDNTHYTVRCTASGITITLPAASGCTGRVYVIINYNTGGTVNTSAYLTPAAASTTTVANQTSVMLQSDGTNWYQIK